jgi:predicted dehydrogenase
MDSRRNFIGTFAGGIAGTLASPANVLRANDRIRFGVIGAGSRGMQLMREALACGNTECAAVADVYRSRREHARRTVPGIRTTAACEELLADNATDAVLIATPQHLHREHFLAALNAGKHIYLEKAAALTLEDALSMRAAREQSPRTVVQIGHQFCSSGMLTDAARFLESGWVGRISGIEASHYRNAPREKPMGRRPLQGDLTPKNVDWKRFLGSAAPRDFDADRFHNWRLYWDYSGGSLHESMSNQLAFWYKLLGASIPHTVSANGAIRLWDDGRETPDTMDVSMDHGEGFYVSWRSNFGNSRLGTGEYLLGTDGAIQRSQQVRYFPEKVNRPGGRETLGSTRTEPRAHMSNFLAAVRSQAEVNCPFEIGYRVSIACAMALESYRQSRPVHWNPETQQIT